MCTLGAKKINGNFFIFKNRDLPKFIETRVIKNASNNVRKLFITDDNGHFEGMNEFGIGIIDATLKPFPMVEYIDSSIYAHEILNKKNINDAIEFIKNNNGSVNTIISDNINTFIIEKTPYDFALTKIEDFGTITNTSIKLNPKNGPNSKESRKSSEIRFKRATELLPNLKSFDDIKEFLSDKKGYQEYSIYKGKKSLSPTWYSFIYDLNNKSIFLFDDIPNKSNYKIYKLEEI